MKPATIAWLAKLRADAAPPGTVFVTVLGPTRSVRIFPEDIVGKSDAELLAYVAGRLNPQPEAKESPCR